MAKNKQTEAANRLKKALLDNLAARGMVEEVYLDKVDEYMDLWKRRQQLEADIEQRGITVLDEKRGMMTENRSVSLEIQVSRQMLSIYIALGFKGNLASQIGGDDDEL